MLGLTKTTGATCALLVLAACAAEEPPRSALVITLDTTRADALGAYGQALRVSPSLDRLAGEGLLFERASTSVPLTLPAHASLWTGLYPPRHTVRVNGGHPLPQSALTVAERAREHGVQTAAFLAASVLDPGFGLDQGFEVFEVPPADPHETGEHAGQRPGVRVASETIAWLEHRDPDRPFLVWMHLFDPHDPYEPPEPFRPPADVHPYYGEIAAADAAVGGVLAWLDERRLLEHTTVLVVGDHGEALGQHGEATHGDYCYESTLHVPLIVAGPGIPRGERSDALVSVVDVAPTVAEVLGLPWPADVDGRSLLDPPDPERGIYFESYTGYLSYGWSPLVGWRDAGGKYLHSARPRLFRPQEDPGEEHDLLASGEVDPAPYRRALRELFARERLAPDDAPHDVDPALAESIRALGYATAGAKRSLELPGPFEDTGRPAPVEREEQHARALRAMDLLARGELAEAQRELERVVADNPLHWAAWDRLAFARYGRGDFAGALAALDTLVAGRPELANAHVYRGRSLWELGRRDEALAAFETAVACAPEDASVLHPYAVALEKLGRDEEARAVRARIAPRETP